MNTLSFSYQFSRRLVATALIFLGLSPVQAQADFTGPFDIDNWVFISGGEFAFVDANTFSITLTGSDDQSGASSTTYFQVEVPSNYWVSFDWVYNTDDSPNFDWGGVVLSEEEVRISGPSGSTQSGSVSGLEFQGGTFGFYVYSYDNTFGPATFSISNFRYSLSPQAAPVWTGNVSQNWNNAGNWSSGEVPNSASSTIHFADSLRTNVSVDSDVALRRVRFLEDASAYTLTVQNGRSLSFFGGIENESQHQQTIVNRQLLEFRGSAEIAGDVLIRNEGTLRFKDDSNAGDAVIESFGGAELYFEGFSSAGNATIHVNGPGNSFMEFASAGNSTINIRGGAVNFFQSSTAGNATINIQNPGGLYFYGEATAGGARVQFVGGGYGLADLDVSSVLNEIEVGAIDGNGKVYLGGNTLITGGLDASTEISGQIHDGGFGGGSGGALVKVGEGILTLSGSNTYTGSTTVRGGTLLVEGSIASSSEVTVENNAILAGNGITSSVTLEAGATLSPGSSAGLLTIDGDLRALTGSLLYLEIGGATRDLEYDGLNIWGTFEAGGILQVVLLNGFSPEEADLFQLFSFYSLTGIFDDVWLPTLASGLAWDVSALYSNGELSVIAVPEMGSIGFFLFAMLFVLGIRRWQQAGIKVTPEA